MAFSDGGHRYSYLAVGACGCVYGVCADSADELTARFVAEAITLGRHVERVSRDEALERFTSARCPHVPALGGRPARLLTEDAAFKIARDVAWNVMQDDNRGALCAQLSAVAGDQDDNWWRDISERVEEGISDALARIPAVDVNEQQLSIGRT